MSRKDHTSSGGGEDQGACSDEHRAGQQSPNPSVSAASAATITSRTVGDLHAALSKGSWLTCESGPIGCKVAVGFSWLEDAQAFHKALVHFKLAAPADGSPEGVETEGLNTQCDSAVREAEAPPSPPSPDAPAQASVPSDRSALLYRLRAAFNSDRIADKNLALRRAYDALSAAPAAPQDETDGAASAAAKAWATECVQELRKLAIQSRGRAEEADEIELLTAWFCRALAQREGGRG